MVQERQTFTVQRRDQSGKGVARKLRAQGLIPGVCYGAGTDSVGVTADPDALYKLLTTKRSTNVVFELAIEDGPSYSHVMVRDYQIDPIRQELIHADFVVIDPAKPLTVKVPVETTGRPVGVREGGRLQMVRGEVPVVTRADAIPERFVHDVSEMGLGDALLASELELPEGVEPAYKIDFAVARIAIPRGATVEEKEAEEAALAEAEAEAAEAAEGEEAGEEGSEEEDES